MVNMALDLQLDFSIIHAFRGIMKDRRIMLNLPAPGRHTENIFSMNLEIQGKPDLW